MIYFLITFVANGRIFKLPQARDEYASKKRAIEAMHKNIISIPENEAKLTKLKEYVNSQDMLTKIKQEAVIIFLNKYFSSNNMKVSVARYNESVNSLSMNLISYKNDESTFDSKIKEIESLIIKEEENPLNEKKPNASPIANQQAISIRSINVGIDFECSYNNMINFINQMQDYPYEITITNINFSIENNKTKGTMDFIFYELPKLKDYVEKNQDWIWVDVQK